MAARCRKTVALLIAVAGAIRAAVIPSAYPPSIELEKVPSPAVIAERGLIGRRAAAGSNDFSLKQAESWYWGNAANPNVNVTGYTSDPNKRFLSMERFVDRIKYATCDESHVSFKFKDSASFDEAKQEWDWINNDSSHYIDLVTENNDCVANISLAAMETFHGVNTTGPRQPHMVTSAFFDESELLARFYGAGGTAITWEEMLATGGYLRYSSLGILSSSESGIAPNATSSQSLGHAQGTPHPHDGSPFNESMHIHHVRDLEKRIDTKGSIDLAHDFSGNIFKQTVDDVTASLDCSPCSTAGTLNLDFELTVIPFEASLTITPSGLDASFTLALTLDGALTTAIDESITLATIPLGAGITGPGFSIGPSLVVSAQAGITEVTASTTLSFGVDISIPDDSKAVLDFTDSSKNSITDFKPQFKPIGPNADASVSVSGNVGPEVAIELSIQALGMGAAAGLLLKAPELTLDLSAQASTSGVCGGTSLAGVEFDVGLGAELDAFGGIGDVKDFPNQVTLVSTSTALFSTCIGLGGFSPPAATDTTATATTTAASTVTCPAGAFGGVCGEVPASTTTLTAATTIPCPSGAQGGVCMEIPVTTSSTS